MSPAQPKRAVRAPSPLREAQKELARKKLMEAATAAFEADGYVDVTIDDIVRRAGTSRGTFYLYFQSKSEVLRAIMTELRREVEEAGLFDDFAAMGEPTIEALQAWFERYVDFYVEHQALWSAVHQALVLEPEFGDVVELAIGGYADLWKSVGLVAKGTEKDRRLAATMLFTLVDRFMYVWLSLGQDLKRSDATRALAGAFFATLKR